MFIDHANCSACGARFQPEAIGSGGRCPSCGTTLGARDLFGVADQLEEEAPERVSFNDLVSGPPTRSSRPAARPAAPAKPNVDRDGSDVFAMLEEIRRQRGR